ncbi:ABC transporter ATP-binding protein [Phytohabitans sp. LJ34]|uniref:ABC transporter ATP-binding protein n=1 Tax=Phytohabitans sp. LJ34 TaxID=3452217 RepID=UPI003F8AB309
MSAGAGSDRSEKMLIAAHGVSKAIDGRLVLDNESIRCEPGTMTALVGPSGSGKTTLLHCLGLLLPVDEGRIVIGTDDVTAYRSAARRRFWRDHAAFVLQDYGIMDEESVAFNVAMRAGLIPRLATGAQERLRRTLDRTGLSGRQDETASHLSGGEKQRLALARAIYKQARIVFVDEPTASLDAANRQKVIDLLAELAADGRTVLVSTHDSEMISACDSRHEIGSNRQAA